MWENRIVGYTEEAPDQLLAHYANPRTHDGKQRDAMRASLDELGIIAPCTVNDRSGNMIDGHMRCEEYITAGITKVPVNHLDLSEQEELKAIAFFDRIGALAGTNQENLEYLLENIELDNAPLENLLEDIRDKKTVLPKDIDDIPEVETPVSRLGDLWLLDGHRVLCGDSTDKATVEGLMDGKKADMVFTDPPYSVNYTKKNKEVFGSKDYTEIKNDAMSVEDTAKTIWKPAFDLLAEYAKDDCSLYCTMPQGGDQMMMMMMMMMMMDSWQVKHELIWVKEAPVFSMNRLDYDYKHEPFVYGWKKKHNWYGKGEFTKSVWEIKRDGNKSHPTMKPVALITNAVLNSTKAGDLVTDAFLGSGSTLIACEQTDRICYGLELDPHYVDVICKRWQTLTGQLPILEATGEAHDFIGK